MKILLAGYFGYGNLGDELVLKTAKAILSDRQNQVIVLERHFRKIKKVISILKQVDILMFPGGSLFQDVTGRGLTVFYYFLLTMLAKLLGKKIFFVAQGVGPIRRPIDFWLVKKSFQQADYISLRNKESAALLMALGITKLQIFNDLFFAAQLKPQRLKPIRKSADKKIKVVFSFRPLNQDYQASLNAVMLNIQKVLKYVEITVVPLQKKQDERIIAELKNIPEIKVLKYDPDQIIAAISAADLAVGMRLHFLILAAKLEVPFVGINYDPKIAALCSSFKMPLVPLNEFNQLGALIIKEIPKIKIRKQQLKVHLLKEEALADTGVIDLKKELARVCG